MTVSRPVHDYSHPITLFVDDRPLFKCYNGVNILENEDTRLNIITPNKVFSQNCRYQDRGIADNSGFVDLAECVTINGIEQFFYHSGSKSDNPVILHLHGGPGNAFSNKAYLLKKWDSYFTMVYWDQRGAGKTALKNPEAVPTFENLLEDIDEIIQYLKKKYNKDKIGIFAHSWGTVIGSIYANQHPEDVAFYIGVGQVISPIPNEIVSYQETVRRLQATQDFEGLNRLKLLGDYPGEKAEDFLRKMWVVRDLQKKMGMINVNSEKNTELIKQSPLFHPEDLYAKNICAKLLPGLFEELYHFSLYDYPLSYKVPIYYLLGKNDWQVPSQLGVDYFKQLTAPHKELILIEDTKHHPMLERPEEFLQAMRKVVHPN